MSELIDITGQRFGKLEVLERAANRGRSRDAMWVCKCDCGKITTVRSDGLRKGRTRSCWNCNNETLTRNRKQQRATAPKIAKTPKAKTPKAKIYRTQYQGKLAPMDAIARTLCNSSKTQAKQRNKKWEITFEQWYSLSQQPCYLCGRVGGNNRMASNGEVFRYNGLDRVDNSRGYTLDNVKPCCSMCNRMKLTHSIPELIAHIRLMLEHLQNK